MLGVAGVIGGVVLGLKGAAEAAIAEEKNIAKLDAALAANIKGWDGNRDAIEQRILAGEKLAFSDDEQRDSLARLVAVTKDVSKAQALQATAMDLARLKGMALTDASELLGKVSAGNIGILARYGIQLKRGTTATEALAEIQRRAAGQAQKYADTTAGAIESLGIVFDDLQEEVGSVLLPVIKDLAVYVRDDLIPAIRDTGKAIGPVIDFIGDLDIGIQDLVASIALWKAGLGPLLPIYLYLEYEVNKATTAMDMSRSANDALTASLERPFQIGPIDLGPLVGYQSEAQKTAAQVLLTSQAMIDLAKTPDAVAADMRESNAIANAAKVAITEPITAATRTAQTQAKAIALVTPLEIARSLRDGSDPVKVASELLRDAFKNAISPAKEIALLQGQLAGAELKRGLASKNPEIRAAADAAKVAIEERLFALKNGVPQIALDTATNYETALQSTKDAVGRAANFALTGARTAFKAMQADSYGYGAGVGQALTNGLNAKYGTFEYAASRYGTKLYNLLHLASPAKEGPLSEGGGPEGWGKSFGGFYGRGLLASIPDFGAMVSGMAQEPMRLGGSAFGQAVSGIARQGGAGGPADIHTHVYLNGREIAEAVGEVDYYARAAAAR